jgi:hypothetical protein
MDCDLGTILIYERPVSGRIAEGRISHEKLINSVAIEGIELNKKLNITATSIAIMKVQPRPIGEFRGEKQARKANQAQQNHFVKSQMHLPFNIGVSFVVAYYYPQFKKGGPSELSFFAHLHCKPYIRYF